MKMLVQRVACAEVVIDEILESTIAQGLLVLGIGLGDTTAAADYLIRKLLNLRIFDDDAGKMNCSVTDVGGSILLISQFTLEARTNKGNRPSFAKAAPPDLARPLYEYCVDQLSASGIHLETGKFGASMRVGLINDGPVTIMLDSTS